MMISVGKKREEINFSERDMELVTHIIQMHVYPLCIIGEEDGKAPTKQSLESCQQLIKKFSEKFLNII